MQGDPSLEDSLTEMGIMPTSFELFDLVSKITYDPSSKLYPSFAPPYHSEQLQQPRR